MPNSNNELRKAIKTALHSFESAPLRDASLALLNTLGYQSDKTISVANSDPEAFLELLAEHNPDVTINKEKALFKEWIKADVLFQLTDEELSNELTLFKDDSVNSTLLKSYLFFTIELKGRDYARGKLTAIARQLNRLFPMPVMVFIKHCDLLSIAVINRRINKRDSEKDVLGKVTIIRDISLPEPHRGHLDILDSFALQSLAAKAAIHDFDTLHAAWEEIFNVELLNKRFYKELSNWYFWALPQVDFPADIESNNDKRRATGLIRLLTRLIFCWFLKEKGLIPERLFDQGFIKQVLSALDDNESSFYLAILQNLFFATLNQRMGRDSKGKRYRRFITEKTFQGKNKEHGVTNLYRHKNLFSDSQTAPALFEDIPFLNGGLFECLDREDEENKNSMIRVDGFSGKAKNQPVVPNLLFFSPEVKGIDLSDVYGDKKRKNETVSGLLHILDRYKFTIVENTPIDQEIALDPELLGKVFENLLASYNEETKTTARKQTGSFYTPRPIVDYMVDESLKAYLTTALVKQHNMQEGDAQTGLDILFAYTEKQHAFKEDEVDALIKAIDSCKILDPACGSGAFPMGMLHKLVYILTKLDPDNAKWKQTQLNKLDSAPMQEELERTFKNNNDDYGRKLYLIENCLYGVDIQPIAIQLSKLRFFISLICDQKTNRDKAKNHGVKPLPNLETKFVAADTLIGLPKETQMELFKSPRVVKIEQELQQVRHDHFAVQKRPQKLSLQRKDKQLRDELADELVQASFADQETSLKLAKWNPYDPHFAADFFEPLWMFDRSLVDGFNIVIGNPPYVQIQKFPKKNKDRWVSQEYKTYAATGDIYCLFYERGFQLLAQDGVLCYITSNKWMRAGYGLAMRKYFLQMGELRQLIDFGDSPIFSAATTYTNILLWIKQDVESDVDSKALTHDLNSVYEDDTGLENMLETAGHRTPMFDEKAFVLADPMQALIREQIEKVGIPLKQWNVDIYRGILTGCNEAFIIDGAKKDELITADPKSAEIIKPILRGRDIKRYRADFADLWMISTYPALSLNIEDYPVVQSFLESFGKRLEQTGLKGSRKKTRNEWFEVQDSIAYHKEFDREKIIFAEIVYDSAFYYDVSSYRPEATAFIITGERIKYLTALLNSRLLTYAFRSFYAGGDLRGNTFRYKKAFIEQLPVPRLEKQRQQVFESFVDFMQIAKMNGDNALVATAQFIEDLIDACVFELYFYEHMAERNLLFLDDTVPLLDKYDPTESEEKKREFLTNFYQTANAPDHPIRNRLLRLTADSPELLAVIKNEGKVS
ncbi:MAG: Eco57I restriction-modification methylase domain-containing protein [Candidatus Polarisedimenticolaceae bacterium]|nr:Eco57I restriction-modification methylase domain-containing protein [Candidatus Polarisedimenticolaceae bacterium]